MHVSIWKNEQAVYIKKESTPDVDPLGDGYYVLGEDEMDGQNAHGDLLRIFSGYDHGEYMKHCFQYHAPSEDGVEFDGLDNILMIGGVIPVLPAEQGTILAEFDGQLMYTYVEDCTLVLDHGHERRYFNLPENFT